MTKKQRITFCREPRETGLGRATQGTRGWYVKVNGKMCGAVSVHKSLNIADRYANPEDQRWYWYARTGSQYRNTVSEKPVTADEAKAACKAWLLEELTQ